jgi:hypothetical protein
MAARRRSAARGRTTPQGRRAATGGHAPSPRAADGRSADTARVVRVMMHKARPGREETFRRLLHALVPAWGRQIPELELRIFRSATGERGIFMAHVGMPVERLAVFQEWATEALERQWGKARTAAFVRNYYDCLEESTQLAVVYEESVPSTRSR